MRQRPQHNQHHGILYLSLGALGVVYGDIGTSPLYALRECFGHIVGLDLNSANVLGILSLIFWSLFSVVCVKYMWVVLKADNKGEGGILSLMALAMTALQNSRHRKAGVIVLGLFGAALLYGDGVITPAISVLSAIEGLKIVTPVFSPLVVPITIFVIVLLFAMQRFGTGKIGIVFGPIILIWFLTLAGLGVYGILQNPEVLLAMNPVYAIQFLTEHGELAFVVLGAVVLAVTGAEALYADMGHFGRKPIRLAWFLVAFPALVLNYFGQGAILLNDASAISNPFYLLAPKWALLPLVVLSTLATVIASQALISGLFSVTRQAVQLGFSPRMQIVHTSSKEIGQIYIPFINWALFVGVIWVVVSFKESSALASAYGIAVTGTMLITTILAFEVAIEKWRWRLLQTTALFLVFIVIDIAFFAANIIKVDDGGWVPLAIGAAFYLLMSTWQKGRKILATKLKERSYALQEFVDKIQADPPQKVAGSAIYMTGDDWGVPVPLLHNLKHNKVLHAQIAILTIKTREIPFILKKERVVINTMAPQFYRIIAQYGFMETPKIKHILEACREQGIYFPIQETTFVLGRETILATGDPTLSIWREKLFALMSRNAERPTSFFKIPPNQVIEVGIQVEI